MQRMKISSTCPSCGGPLSATSADGFCPACLLRTALETFSDEPLPEAGNLALPRTFGPYELIEEIGRGGMGVVYAAHQPALGRRVAIKLLLAGAYASETALRRFQLEAAAAAKLQHPNIVEIHDYGEVDGQPFYAMDLVVGRNLAELCASRPLPARHAAEYLRLLAGAVHYAHQHGILHRDLKPTNVLLDEEDRPRITDFGLAKLLDSTEGATLTGQMLGSPSYAAPEQVTGSEVEITVRSDVYGLGALFYHLLTGRAPFNAATPTETLRLVLDTEPAPPRLLNPDLPRDLETICLKCLAKEPARRYASAAEVAEDVECFLSERPIRARPPSTFYRLRKFARRHRVVVGASAAVVLALVLGLAFALIGFRRAVVQERIARAQQRAAETARGQAEQLVGLMNNELKPALEQRGGLEHLQHLMETTVHYFESLPPELGSPNTDSRHAAALEALAELRGLSLNDSAGAATLQREALALREKVVREQPGDPEAVASKLWNEWQSPQVTNDKTATADRAKKLGRQWQELVARYPDNQQIQQLAAEVLSAYAEVLMPEPQESVAVALQARELVGRLEKAGVSAQVLTKLHQRSLQALGHAYLAAGETAEAVLTEEQALAYCTAALQADPGNLKLRWAAAEAARFLSYRVAEFSLRRARNAERIAREHYRILTELEPHDQQYRSSFAHAYTFEFGVLVNGDFEPFLRFLNEAEAALKRLDPVQTNEALLRQRANYRSYYGGFSNDNEGVRDAAYDECRALLEKLQPPLPPNPTLQQRRNRADLLAAEAHFCAFRTDWTRAARMAREAMDELQAGLKQYPDDWHLHWSLEVNRCVELEMRFRAGQGADAVTSLPAAIVRLREIAKQTPGIDHAAFWIDRYESLYAEAKAKTGDTVEFRRLLEAQLRSAPVMHSFWSADQARAHLKTDLAALLQRDEVPRRLALLEDAATILTSPRGAGRTDHWDRECLARAVQLQTETMLPDANELAELGKQIDETAPRDPAVCERINRIGEATWNLNPLVSAISSPAAQAAQREIRSRLEGLWARNPESAGLRFLTAETYRMEGYVHLALDGRVGAARAGLRDYDARLAPLAGLKAFESVGRTRVDNALHLARLAGSVGDVADARAWLNEADQRFAAERSRLAGAPAEQRVAQIRFQEGSAWVIWWLRDWTELGRLATDAKQEIAAGLKERPGDSELLARDAIADVYAAIATGGSRGWSEGVPLLRRALAALVKAPWKSEVWDLVTVPLLAREALAEALVRSGEPLKARHNLEAWLLMLEEQAPLLPNYWLVQRHEAALSVRLAGLLDPAKPEEAARRQELLNHVAAFLSPENTADRLTVDVQEMIAELGRLKGPA